MERTYLAASESTTDIRSGAGFKRRAALVAADLVVPFLIFARQIGVWTLRPTAAAEMMRADWTTYILAPNFLRTAPLLTFPIGRVPAYISPPGISLAMADANPLLTPVYRLANALSPDHPVQLLGWLLLIAYLLTFYATVRFIEAGARRWSGAELAYSDRLAARGLAAALLIMPFFSMRYIHVSLTNQWVVILALAVACFRRELTRRNVLLHAGVVILAVCIQPYFLPMILAIVAPFVISALRRYPGPTLLAVGATTFVVFGVSVLLGFIGEGFTAAARDYGSFSADLTTLFSPRNYARLLPDLPHHPKNTEGLGFVGLGGLILIVAGFVILRQSGRRLSRRTMAILAACSAMFVLAALPRFRIFGVTILDLSKTPLALNSLGHVFRVNGRFIWALAWLLVLGAGGLLVGWRHPRKLLVVLLVVAIQFADTRSEHIVASSPVPYEQALSALRRRVTPLTNLVELQPPWVAYQCYTGFEMKFDDLAPVLLAASTLRLAVNSGYPARPAVDAKAKICDASAERFEARQFNPRSLYLRSVRAPVVPGLLCEPMTDEIDLCRPGDAAL